MSLQPLLSTIHFVGRDRELTNITELFANSACRLLTLVGPGGIGKTRLALEAARRIDTAFPNGIYFVPLQPLTSPEFIISTIADVLGFQFYSGAAPRQQLLDYLREKSLLLVLDNVEHLLEDVSFVSDMLAAASGVRILATSRERLNLREEWVFEVSGLSYPAANTPSNLETYSAIELFVQQARRVMVSFTLDNASRSAVVRICRLVGGMPLGIELAAAWVRALSCEQIADEIERSLDVLETPARNVEPRHRTMRAALDQSWQLLSHAEQGVFKRLSVFRGGFTREAAEYVAGATLRTLASLVDKSMVRVTGNGRYDLHELLRQYGEEKLCESPAEREQVCDRHCAYYAEFMGQWQDDGEDIGSREATAAIREELENVRVAMKRIVEERAWNLLPAFLQVLGHFYEVTSRHHEGAEVYRLAGESLRKEFTPGSERQARLLGLALSWGAWFLIHLVRDHEARQLAQESLSLVLPLGNTFEAYNSYKVLSFATPEHGQARAFAKEAMKHARESGYDLGVIFMYSHLSFLSFLQGDYEESERLAQEGLALCRKHKWLYGEIWLLQRLSNAAEAQNNYVEARRMAQAALSAAQTVGSRHAISMQHLTLGNIAYAEGNYSDAVQHYDTSLQLAQEVHNLQHIVWTISSLGCAVGRLGDADLARDYFREALNIAHSTQDASLQRSTIKGIAELMMIHGHAERALELLVMLLHQSNNTGMYRQKDERLYRELELSLSPEIVAAARERGIKLDLNVVVAELLADFGQPSQATELSSISQPHADPLTARELEILSLIEEGMSNREIAAQLVLAVSTVKWYVNEIFGKLHVTNRTQAVTRARALGVLS